MVQTLDVRRLFYLIKTAINDANREAQRNIYDLAEKKATAQFWFVSKVKGQEPILTRIDKKRLIWY